MTVLHRVTAAERRLVQRIHHVAHLAGAKRHGSQEADHRSDQSSKNQAEAQFDQQ